MNYILKVIYKADSGKLIHGDNIEAMKEIKESSVDSCISDFPYNLSFMGRKWDTTGNFYEWCKDRAEPLHRIIKPGGYVCIFGHPKTNHRMKSAFEDVGFNIVEEIDWVYGTGFPKNQDIGKLFDKRKGGSVIVDEIMKYLKQYRITKGVSVSQLDKDVFNGTTKYSRWYEEKNDGRLPTEEDWFKLKEYLKFDNTYDELIRQAEREKIGEYTQNRSEQGSWATENKGDMFKSGSKTVEITLPSTELSKKWNGWKTAGLKPAHEPITVFQKPLEKNYCYNIEKHNVGAMNIDACRIPLQETGEDKRLGGKGTWSTEKAAENIYEGGYAGVRVSSSELGRFPANMIFDSSMGEVLDGQSGISEGKRSMRGVGYTDSLVFGTGDKNFDTERGFNDKGGASRYFLKIDQEDFVPFLYCAKTTKKEKGEGNTHVTVKPKALVKWLIKLVTPIDGKTIDITAGSGTHGLACEELNKDEGYNLKWINIELLNTEKEPYCNIAMNRIKSVI